MGTKVRLREPVDYETLEAALTKAAEEVGWRAQVKDVHTTSHYELGSVAEVQKYLCTEVTLRGIMRLAATLTIPNKEPTDVFEISTRYYVGSASKGKVMQYLEAVSRELYG